MMFEKIFLAIAMLFFNTALFAQSNLNSKKTLLATKINHAPDVDGKLNDDCWKGIPEAKDFIQFTPSFGNPANFKSVVKLVYTDEAIYVGAMLYDPEPSKIKATVTPRDVRAGSIADQFILGFDTYLDGQNGYRFEITPANAQTDARVSPGVYDVKWDAVWQSKTSITDSGWIAEYRIPYSAIRFPKTSVQSWGLQFSRSIQRTGELVSWSPTDPRIQNIVQQWGILENLRDIKPPLRLSFTPYIAAYAEKYPVSINPDIFRSRNTVNGGMDIKWGINESFTIDANLIPDFGQVQSDNTVLNLSPFEVQYEERRPFFTEGTELFNKGVDLFYSRRIGGLPAGYFKPYGALAANEEVSKNPSQTSLYNAIKFSGRTKRGLGIGMLNAIAKPIYAIIKNNSTGESREIQTGVVSNYNILVLDQNLKNNSSLTFINTSVLRKGQNRDADVASILLSLLNKKQSHRFRAEYKRSMVFTTINTNRQLKTGAFYKMDYGKVSGKYQYLIGNMTYDDKWDPNDLGILRAIDITHSYARFSIYELHPKKLQSWNTQFQTDWYTRYKPFTFQDLYFTNNTNITFRNYSYFGTYISIHPFKNNDFNEARTPGRVLKRPRLLIAEASYNTDSRKKVSLGTTFTYADSELGDDAYFAEKFYSLFRIGRRFNISYNLNISKDAKNFGYAGVSNATVLIGSRKINTIENSVSSELNLSEKMGINVNVRHYWTRLQYLDIYDLLLNGDILKNTMDPHKYDLNYNVFNVDMVYRWQFAQGSFLNLVWKNNISQDDGFGFDNYKRNLRKTFETPHANSFILKMIYYLDYNKLQHSNHKA